MQRPATKQSPSARTSEKSFIGWIKDRGICVACSSDGGVIAHHCVGSSAKTYVGIERVMIGHWFVIGLCQSCDNIVTRGSRREFENSFGSQSSLWLRQIEQYNKPIPENVIEGITNYGK